MRPTMCIHHRHLITGVAEPERLNLYLSEAERKSFQNRLTPSKPR